MQGIRMIKRTNDGAIKRMQSGAAARLVAKGGYAYIDGGTDDSLAVPSIDAQRYKEITNTKPEILNISRALPIGVPELAPEQVRALRDPKVIKKNEIPKERLEQIKAINLTASKSLPEVVPMTPGHDSNALKNLINKTKSKRAKNPKEMVTYGEEE